MVSFAIYGKGGIGKSTTVSNLSVAFTEMGFKTMQIGCDPKADSTFTINGGVKLKSVLDVIKEKGNDIKIDEIVKEGYKGIICAEAGGPTPGMGCAGRGIIVALDKLKELGVYEIYKPQIVIYDVLGDVVCGGFSMPMRQGYADKVYIVTSGENMAIHAGANIAVALSNFKNRGYASLGGIILNHRNVKNENEKVEELAKDINTKIIGEISRDELVIESENLAKTVMEAFKDSNIANEYRALAKNIIKDLGIDYA